MHEDGAEQLRCGDLGLLIVELDLPAFDLLEVNVESDDLVVHDEERITLLEYELRRRRILPRHVEVDEETRDVVPALGLRDAGVEVEDDPTTGAFPGGHEVVVAALFPLHVDATELQSESHEVGDVEKTLTEDGVHEDLGE